MTTPVLTPKPGVAIGPASVLGWLASAICGVSTFVGSHNSAEWKAILGGLILAATNWGRHYQAAKKQ